jgi:GT2 family glycosyltransferase
MKIAAVILNWCDAKATIHCVDTLRGRSAFAGPVYVIDNASPDGSFEVLKSRLPHCVVLRNAVNSGYTGGNNHGLRQAFDDGCDAVLILNNDVDVRLSPGFWEWVEQKVTKCPMSLIGIPVSRNQGADDFSFPAEHGFVTRAIVQASGLSIQQMPTLLCGCAMVISRHLYERVGLLNEEFFMYCDEFEYAIRSAKFGDGITHSPVELGFVVREEVSGDRAPYVYYYQARNMITIALRCSSLGRVMATAMVILVSLRSAARTRSMNNFKAALLGVIHGFSGQQGRYAAVHSLRSK